MNKDVLVSAHEIRKVYSAPAGDLEVLRGIDLKVFRGEILAIMGLSGVGKSTLLNILGLLDSISSGQLRFHFDGTPIDTNDLSPKRQARLRNEFLGFVFQSFHLLPDLNVLENVLLPAMISRTRSQFARDRGVLLERAHDLMQRVGVDGREQHKANTLSGGERQRVAIARALMNEPALLLCDEPTGNLDLETSKKIHTLFRGLNEDLQTTILVVTHDPDLANQAHSILNMVDGRFQEDGNVRA